MQNSEENPVVAPSAPKVTHRSRAVGRLRGKIPNWQFFLLSGASILVALGVWWRLTAGEIAEERIVSPIKMPSPAETVGQFKSLWFDKALTRNTVASLRRVVLGFGLATAVGVPLGVLCGCFPRFGAFFAPLTIFGRNIPMAALIPLTFLLFGGGEGQKIMFIFIAAVAFILADSAQAVRDVSQSYVDTAYTLGAAQWQVVLKVLTPLALPTIFNSLRLLFGLAFGYIMLAEVVQIEGESGGLGGIINVARRLGPQEHIYLVLMLIPVLALIIDRVLFWVQKQAFPYRYGGAGLLAIAWVQLTHCAAGAKQLVWNPTADAFYADRVPQSQPPAATPDDSSAADE